MRLEDYFDFISPDQICFKGQAIGLEQVLFDYLAGKNPEEIIERLSSLSLEQIYAAITYYLHNQTELDIYLDNLENWQQQRYHKYQANPLPIVQRLRAAKNK